MVIITIARLRFHAEPQGTREKILCVLGVSALIQSPQVLVYAGFNYQGNANAVINLKERLKNFIAEGAFTVDHFYIFYVQWKAGHFIIF